MTTAVAAIARIARTIVFCSNDWMNDEVHLLAPWIHFGGDASPGNSVVVGIVKNSAVLVLALTRAVFLVFAGS